MNHVLHVFAAIGVLVCLAPVILIGIFVACHFLAKAKLRRDARLTALKTQ